MNQELIDQKLLAFQKNGEINQNFTWACHRQPSKKTCIKTLLDSGVSHNSVAQLSGHKSLKSLDSYAVASHQQQRHMSKILSGKENSEPKEIQTSQVAEPYWELTI